MSKVRRFAPNRHNTFLVLTRSHKPGDDFMQWQPLSRFGWKVVCLSEHDAHECVLFAGGQMYPRPAGPMDDDQYERWLLRHHFRVQPYELTGKGEMTFHEWIQGWIPGGDEFRTAQSSPAIIWRSYERPAARRVALAG